MMKLKSFYYALLAGFTLAVLIHAQDQSEFISIDCGWIGYVDGSPYPDPDDGINYTPDENFIDTGILRNISSLKRVFSDVRSFPEGIKNCYTLKPPRGKNGKYLIRASFLYGNYDGKNSVPQFDLYLGANLWETIILAEVFTEVSTEIIHVPSTDYIFVCLINTGHGVPFISALELRPLNSSLYKTQYPTESLILVERLDFGSNQSAIRYPNDTYDRIWMRKTNSDWETWSPFIGDLDDQALNTSDYHVPIPVMSTAIKPSTDDASLVFSCEFSADANYSYYSYKHFAELEILDYQTREFILSENGNTTNDPIRPDYLSTSTIVSGPLQAKSIHIEITKTVNSDLPPILNAIEIYRVKDFSQSQTLEKDVYAMIGIKKTYQVKNKSTWQGDPCVPKNYFWEGLNCSGYENNSPLRIISLNLSLSGLTGEITPIFADLTALRNLDLSYNSFTGPVPDFFSRMPSLEVLNLKGNQFTGSLPPELKKRVNSGSLILSMDGLNNTSSPKKNGFLVPLVASVAATLLSLIIGFAIFVRLQTRRKNVAGKAEAQLENKNDSFEAKHRQYAYSDVIEITNNFARVLGEGGFGTVYHGCIGDTDVAVKVLSPSSAQGYKEFHAEVKLFMRVHHRNLTVLVGYCLEGKHMALIYEYMPMGTLEQHLSGKIPYILSWQERMRIAVDAAQGLEYLHNGCKPPIVHRDVKPSNILLNNKLQAKISDFGLCRVFPNESSAASASISTVIAGTAGYLDPECLVMSSRLNEKSDVYSLGLVLLNIITGQPVILKSSQNIHIIEWVKSRLAGGDIRNIVDPRLGDNFDINSAWKAVEVALACTSQFSSTRPTMTEVVMDLKECLAIELSQNNNEGEYRVNSIVVDTESAPLAR